MRSRTKVTHEPSDELALMAELCDVDMRESVTKPGAAVYVSDS